MKVYYRGEAIAFTELKKQPESLCPDSPARPAGGGAEGEKRPSVAPTLPDYADTNSQGADRSASGWNAHFRFALTTGLRCSAHSNRNTTTQKGDISNKLTMGTFLLSLDTQGLFIDFDSQPT